MNKHLSTQTQLLAALLICGGIGTLAPQQAFAAGAAAAVTQSQRKVTGTVSDILGSVVGATVVEKGNPSNGTITDNEGHFSLNVPDGATLVVSFVGYTTQEVQVTKGQAVKVFLREDSEQLNEVVVVGYGTVKKRDLTGSVSSVNSNTLTVASSPSTMDALQGKMPGVQIQKNAARPGGSFNVRVRGLSSINNSNSPLWVIDGIPTNEAVNDINPDDIEKIDVLKDASATAIYGSRGANGVIIVTTKSGKEGKFSISYDGYAGVRTPANLPKMMNGDQYYQFRKTLFENQGKDTSRDNATFFTPSEWEQIDNHDYTDWVGLTLRNGLQYSNTVTASGGDAKSNFMMSIGQLHEEGTTHGQGYDRYNMHLNMNRKFLSNWEAGGNMYFTYADQEVGSYEALRSAYRLIPMTSPYDEDGNLTLHVYRTQSVLNPLMDWGPEGETRENLTYRAFGNFHLQVEPIKGLTVKTQFSPQYYQKRNGLYIGVNSKNSGGTHASANASYTTETQLGWVWDNQINYAKEFGEHSINASLVQSMQFDRWEDSNQASKGFSYSSLWYNLDAAGLTGVTSSTTDYTQSSLASVLARIQYSYAGKYLLTVSGRADGSSRLAKGNKWAFFPSAALAWRASDEEFLKDVDWLSNLKVRASYGVTGNDAVSIYGTQASVDLVNYDFGGTAANGYYKTSLANEDLTWEKTYEINLGLDFGFLRDRISGSVDVYQRDAKDLIMKRNVPVTSGWSSIWDNIGWVRNRGVELSLNVVPVQTKDFTWSLSGAFDYNKNAIKELYGGTDDDVSNKWFIGEPVNVNYDYNFIGIWQENEKELAAQYGQTPGQVRVEDINNDGKITSADKKILGQKTPKWNASLTSTFNYKGWDLSIYAYTQQGVQLQSTFLSTFLTLEGDMNQMDVDYWTPENPTNEYPQPGNKGKYFDAMRYNDCSFVKIGSITLGYSLPHKLLDKAHIKNLRLYFTTNNPFTFTSYQGFDPEWATQNTWGEATSYRTFIGGLKLEF